MTFSRFLPRGTRLPASPRHITATGRRMAWPAMVVGLQEDIGIPVTPRVPTLALYVTHETGMMTVVAHNVDTFILAHRAEPTALPINIPHHSTVSTITPATIAHPAGYRIALIPQGETVTAQYVFAFLSSRNSFIAVAFCKGVGVKPKPRRRLLKIGGHLRK